MDTARGLRFRRGVSIIARGLLWQLSAAKLMKFGQGGRDEIKEIRKKTNMIHVVSHFGVGVSHIDG